MEEDGKSVVVRVVSSRVWVNKSRDCPDLGDDSCCSSGMLSVLCWSYWRSQGVVEKPVCEDNSFENFFSLDIPTIVVLNHG